MAEQRTVIITCAVTGSIHTPSMSRYLPISAAEIADAAVGAAEAGAAIIHLHARDPRDGRPSQDPEHFAPILANIKERTDAVVNITTGGSPHMSVEERVAPARQFQPELASLNMGSMNFGLYPMLDRYDHFQREWEVENLEASRDLVFKNTFADIERILAMGRANGTRFEFECYDTSHLYTLAHFQRRGLIDGVPLVQTVMGLLGGIGGHAEDLMHLRRAADRLLAPGYQWSVLGAGRQQIPLATIGAAVGSHVRVGLEDSLWIGPGKLARSNAQQVRQIRRVLEALHLEVATPDDARAILGLKGASKVKF